MNFTAKFKGPPPPTQDQTIPFTDCDTNTPTTEAPTGLNITSSAPWLTGTQKAPTVVTVAVNQGTMAVGTYTASLSLKIPDLETCVPGQVFAVPVNLTVKKGQVKFP